MDKILKSVIKQSLTPPPPLQKKQFINSISYPQERFHKMFLTQIGYIRKRIWILSALAVFAAFFYTHFLEVPENILAVVSAIFPLFSLCTITELYKSRAHHMEELELVCKYNLSVISLIRLTILGIANFLLLLLFVIIAGKSNFGILRNTVYITAPYLLSCHLSLLIISKSNAKDAIYACGAVSGAVSIVIMIINSNYQLIYHDDFTYIWIIVCAVLTALLFHNLIEYRKSQEELQWSLR